MKQLILSILLPAFVLFPEICSAQQAEQKVLATLQSGEEPMYAESCIPLSFTNGNLYLVTRKNNQYFVYENGTRKGPFNAAPANALNNCTENSGGGSNCAVKKSNNNVRFEKYVKVGSNGQMQISYNGKTYSEITQVTEIVESDNGLKIAALGTNAQWEPYFLTPDGKIIPLEGEIASLILSPSGNTAIVTMKGSETKTLNDAEVQMANIQKMAEEMQSVDMGSMTPDQMTAFIEGLQKKYGISDNAQSGSPDYYMYLSNGNKIGPYKLDGYAGDNPAFNVSGGDNWYFIDDNKLYINGLLVKDFGDNSPSVCNTWISADGKRYATFLGYEKLVFSDGQTYADPIQIEAKTENGKTYLIWLTLNANNQVVLYKKAI